ncbi:MAG: hypothetical protein LBE86_14510 [Gemmobacter sp.]|jgi:hypothetical protein|nr:hypothetical protein [Gemmobacter sp.]
MTATPHVFSDAIKKASAVPCSADDAALWLDRRADSLTDQARFSTDDQLRLTEGAELKLGDATKIIGRYKALIRHSLTSRYF